MTKSSATTRRVCRDDRRHLAVMAFLLNEDDAKRYEQALAEAEELGMLSPPASEGPIATDVTGTHGARYN